MTTPAEAVSAYLDFLATGSESVDDERRSELQAGLEAAASSADRVAIRAQMASLGDRDGSERRAAFVAHALSWVKSLDADAEAVVAVLAEDGVGSDVLAEAGLGSTQPVKASTSKRRTRVSADQIRAAVPAGSFTKKDLVAGSGASIGSVTKVIDQMVADGELKSLGADPDWAGRGRAPVRYQA